jgi:Na+-translocating ferredoxin:NAD+ oxidoreductase RnfD subunit
MTTLRKIWNGSPERDIAGLKNLILSAVMLGGTVWLWGSIFRWAGYTLGFLAVVALFCLVCWWIAKKLGDEDAWHLVAGGLFGVWILVKVSVKLVHYIVRFDGG